MSNPSNLDRLMPRAMGVFFAMFGGAVAYGALPDPNSRSPFGREGDTHGFVFGVFFALVGVGIIFWPWIVRIWPWIVRIWEFVTGKIAASQRERNAQLGAEMGLPLLADPLPPNRTPFDDIPSCEAAVARTLTAWRDVLESRGLKPFGIQPEARRLKLTRQPSEHEVVVKVVLYTGVVAELSITASAPSEGRPSWLMLSTTTVTLGGRPLPGGVTDAWRVACGLAEPGESGDMPIRWDWRANRLQLTRRALLTEEDRLTTLLPELDERLLQTAQRLDRAEWPDDASAWAASLLMQAEIPELARMQAAGWLLQFGDEAYHDRALAAALHALVRGDGAASWGLVDDTGERLLALTEAQQRAILGDAHGDDEPIATAFWRLVWSRVLLSMEAAPARWIEGTPTFEPATSAALKALAHHAELAPEHPLRALLGLNAQPPPGGDGRAWWWQLGQSLASCEAPVQATLTEVIWKRHDHPARFLALAHIVPSWSNQTYERVSQLLWRPGVRDEDGLTDALLSQLWLYTTTDLARRDDLIELAQRHGGQRTLAALRHVASNGPDLPRAIDARAEEVAARLEASVGPLSEHDGMLTLAADGPAGGLSVVGGERGGLSATD